MVAAKRNEAGKETHLIRQPASIAVSNYVSLPRFALLIGKTHQAVKDMAKAGKLPLVAVKNPDVAKPQPEHYVDLAEWNRGMQLSRETMPEEIRNGWLRWIGLNV
jgi:hypothetical protein